MVGRTPLAVAMLFTVTCAVYIASGAPTVLFGDSGEFQTLGNIGGIAHQTGYPIYVLVAQAFTRLVPGEPAWRVNAMSAFFGAASVCMVFALMRALGMRHAIAFAGALLFAGTFTVWWASMRAEVYTLALFLFLASLRLGLAALKRPRPGILAATGFAIGLTLTAHLCYAPALGFMGVMITVNLLRKGASRGAGIVALAVSFVMGLTPYLYFLHVDGSSCATNYLRYAIEPGAGQFGLTPSAFDEPWERIAWLFTGKQMSMNYYFLDPRGLARNLTQVLTIEFLFHYGPFAAPLFIAGGLRWLRRPESGKTLMIGVFGVSVLFNMVCGARHLRPLFIMPATVVSSILIAAGIERALDRFALPRALRSRAVRLAAAAAAMALLLAAPHAVRVFVEHAGWYPARWRMPVETGPRIASFVPSLHGYRKARDYGERVFALAPAEAVIVGDFQEMMALFYLHYVEGARPDVVLQLGFPEHAGRIAAREPRTRPVVFTRPLPELMEMFPPQDTIVVDPANRLYIHGPASRDAI